MSSAHICQRNDSCISIVLTNRSNLMRMYAENQEVSPAACCRVLYGKVHVLSYDWADARHSSSVGSDRKASAAKRVLDKVVEPTCEPAVIFPTAGGNIHQFTAVTDCAVLDVLAPPYSPGGGEKHL